MLYIVLDLNHYFKNFFKIQIYRQNLQLQMVQPNSNLFLPP